MRRLLGLALCFYGIASSLLLAEDVIGAEPATLLASAALSSASGPMSSTSYSINTSLGELGWVGRSQSTGYAIHIGSAWTRVVSAGATAPPIPAIPIPSLAGWGLVVLALALAAVAVLRARTARTVRPARS